MARKPALAKPTTIQPPKGRRPVPANCRVDELNVDATYQRELSRESGALIRAIAKDWDWSLCQPLIVARRPDDTLWVVDGQHRRAAAEMRGDIVDLPCIIIHYGTIEAEAQAFVALNTARRPLSTYAIWKAAIAANDAQAILLRDVLARHSLRLSGNNNKDRCPPGEISCVTKLQRLLATHGEPHLDRVIGVLVGAFGDEPLVHGPILITALSALFAQHDDTELATDLMIRVLRGKNQDMWARAFNARMAQTGDGYQIAAIAVLRNAAFHSPTSAAPPPRNALLRRPPPSPKRSTKSSQT
jgi:hypothetical protein